MANASEQFLSPSSPASSSPSPTTSSVVLVVVKGDKGGNGGCCRVPTCLASINQWEWHFGEVLGAEVTMEVAVCVPFENANRSDYRHAD